jgi:hypothetical protein
MQWQGAINKPISQQLIGLPLIIAAAIIAAEHLPDPRHLPRSPDGYSILQDKNRVTMSL